MWRLLLYFVAGFFLWQFVRYVLQLFASPAAQDGKITSPQTRERAPRRFDAIEEAEYQELESKPKTPTN